MATRTSPPVTLLVLGAAGDLTRRLLLPGLATLLGTERDRRVRVRGADRAQLSPAQWRARVEDAFSSVETPTAVTSRVVEDTDYVSADILDPDALSQLVGSCGEGPLVVFFALPPSVTMDCCELLARVDLPEVTRLALEKPFGTSRESARRFNGLLHRVVPEEQVFRIDHFLGVNTVLNLVGLRFANRLLQPVWDRDHIERVEIVYDEDLALEGRAGYYDGAGALRDMLQSHLLQVLALFAMESVATLDAEELQDQKAQVLRATHPWGRSPSRAARRARYTAGRLGRRRVPDYTAEKGVDPSRMTETLAQVTLGVETNRWAGVPFVLRSGKALGTARKEVVVTFREVAHLPEGFTGRPGPDRLVIGLKPGSMDLTMTMNAEGDPFDLEQKMLSAKLAPPRMQAYGEVLGQVLDGSRLLSVRADSAEECWRIVEPVLRAFGRGSVPMEEYAAGSDGPEGWQR
ncbi:glucose-6-phosphate dehydrogenase [Phycicoccus endophyticus]|uniref:Glucose-6-phosphate 1-dehydrogenase n=1 Tax=Phycicoccus endophyticus TaxID=1690220 RepID=A0A7G9R104_9MICO|nr:glucose-6-phosphate dehydrogenase [Phycicoccus endophyticus]NHI20599.1 glucose-6-phosphate dehydrogenase [Phycicoccus endophyticus]QNN49279.1 glucose-6-phosphate dehydrogenase [Phycicoccus endophyticus]